MSHGDQKIDARDMRDGGWSWVQHELYTFFQPIIGKDATHLYHIMAWLIPKRAVDPVFDLSISVIEKNSMMSRGAVQGCLKILHATGMVEQQFNGHRKACTYVLGDLKKLIRLGESEMRKRLASVHGMNAKRNTGGSGAPPADTRSNTKHGSGRAPERISNGNGAVSHAASSTDQRQTIVQEMNANAAAASVEENLWKTTNGDESVFTKPALCVQETGGLRSQRRAPLIPDLNLHQDLNHSPRPAAAEGFPTPSELDEDDRRERQFAVAKVMRECNLASQRFIPIIERAMQVTASKSDDAPNWNAIAERMTAARLEYAKFARAGLLRFSPYGVDRFFLEGIWCDEGLWAVDQEKMRQRAAGLIGSGRDVFGEATR